jgi:hypothetical protein
MVSCETKYFYRLLFKHSRRGGGHGNNVLLSLFEIILEVGFFDGIVSNQFSEVWT